MNDRMNENECVCVCVCGRVVVLAGWLASCLRAVLAGIVLIRVSTRT